MSYPLSLIAGFICVAFLFLIIGTLTTKASVSDSSNQISYELFNDYEHGESGNPGDSENEFSEKEIDCVVAESTLPLFQCTVHIPSKRSIAAAIPLLSYDIQVPPPKLSLI